MEGQPIEAEAYLVYLGSSGDYKIYAWAGTVAEGFKLLNTRLGDDFDFPAYAAGDIIQILKFYEEYRKDNAPIPRSE